MYGPFLLDLEGGEGGIGGNFYSPIEGGTQKWPFGPGNEEAALYRVKTKN